jgi:hypothetical protein
MVLVLTGASCYTVGSKLNIYEFQKESIMINCGKTTHQRVLVNVHETLLLSFSEGANLNQSPRP